MYESGHTLSSDRDEMQEALRRLEAALVHYEQPAAADGGSDPAHGALSRAVQLMREEAQALRIALEEL